MTWFPASPFLVRGEQGRQIPQTKMETIQTALEIGAIGFLLITAFLITE
jgi:hypothetical protein